MNVSGTSVISNLESRASRNWALLEPSGDFAARHNGPSEDEVTEMLRVVGVQSLDEMVDKTVPASIRMSRKLALPAPLSEPALLAKLRVMGTQNKVFRSLIGMGYYGCVTAPVIQRNILENPGWYTSYTPYQAEIAQGRLEALMNFQTMVADLTGLPIANASLLDEATAAAEAMVMCRALSEPGRSVFFMADNCHPQTLEVVHTRAMGLGITPVIAPAAEIDFKGGKIFGILLQYPATDGQVTALDDLTTQAHRAGMKVVVATDLLALTLLRPPGEFGADIAVGSSQRLGMPMGYGGPHAAFLAAREEFTRKMPGRIVGLSRDAHGEPAYRLALQTREQHIRREKATSNICTAQVLPAIVAAAHAVYYGPRGLTDIALRIRAWTLVLARGLQRLGCRLRHEQFFDTLRIIPSSSTSAQQLLPDATARKFNFRYFNDGTIGIALDELTDLEEVHSLMHVFSQGRPLPYLLNEVVRDMHVEYPMSLARTSRFLTHPVFNSHHSETQMQRYLRHLESRDLSLTFSMIPLGSCTMKLNAAAEMTPITMPQWTDIHPFCPPDQAGGYQILMSQLERFLCEITGFFAVSFQPNAGSQGEYSGLMVIRAYHAAQGHGGRNICLIPVSAHGTNPASAALAGLSVVPVACDPQGNIDLADLQRLAAQHQKNLACLMVTYPSTHGVFEEHIREICAVIHAHGGQIYMDGANMNAQIGLCRPADMGADVCHLNLHKTFCIPHGGGGPGIGPIAVAEHLVPFLPGHPVISMGTAKSLGTVSAAPYGSALMLLIPWAYISLMSGAGLTRATELAILNANYMAARLKDYYPIRFVGTHGLCAHEFIADAHAFEASAGVKVEDIAKRLMDYGFHAPTISWPEHGALMIEPTESESKAELDRFCEALIAIRGEIREIETGKADCRNNVLKNAPHTARMLAADPWPFPYSREKAAFPLDYLKVHKFWPAVGRIDNPYGDRHLICTCPTPTQAEDNV
ncbi:MAG: aminomethyl-transferring glycine dehydrogenase [Planctomycetia bacterium]|nr:aminomethyl-transferring glycine dehydrogenase [Planctomycetia bacterium]